MRGSTAGWHLLVDSTVKKEAQSILNSRKHLTAVFDRLVDVLGMRVLIPPIIAKVELSEANLSRDEDDGGLTGFCVISTSHMSIHTWPLRHRFSMDVFSCKIFDPSAALAVISKMLQVETQSAQFVERAWLEGDHTGSTSSSPT